jgi:hypothetical protein
MEMDYVEVPGFHEEGETLSQSAFDQVPSMTHHRSVRWGIEWMGFEFKRNGLCTKPTLLFR